MITIEAQPLLNSPGAGTGSPECLYACSAPKQIWRGTSEKKPSAVVVLKKCNPSTFAGNCYPGAGLVNVRVHQTYLACGILAAEDLPLPKGQTEGVLIYRDLHLSAAHGRD